MSNIKFFPYGVDLFSLTAVTSEDTGHEKEYMLDRRLATYWKADSSSNQDIDIDLGADYADYSIDHVLLYCDPTDGATITIYAATQSDYSDQTEIVTQGIIYGGWQFVPYLQFTGTNSYRYWRIRFTNLSAAPSVALIFIGPSIEITIRYNKGGIIEETDYDVKLSEAYGGQRGIPRAPIERKYWEFLYEYLDLANKNKLDTLLSVIHGSRYPFYYKDTNDNYHYVRFIGKNLGAKEVEHQLYNTNTIRLEEELGT